MNSFNRQFKNHAVAIQRLISAALIVQIACMIPFTHAQPAEGYKNTIAALEALYAEEVQAHNEYMQYSEQTCVEGYPKIAHLFKALAISEGIHGRNFGKLLEKLGGKTSTVRNNNSFTLISSEYDLNNAPKVERDEIGSELPNILENIHSEKHQQAITAINNTWKSEQQHRDLLIQIQKAEIMWFGVSVDKLEDKDYEYHVCQECGSTLTMKPKDKCNICGSDVSKFKTIAPISPASCPVHEYKGVSDL